MSTTNRILLKKSSVVGKIPGNFDIQYGELALNFSDGRLYFKNSDNNIDFFESGSGDSFLPFAANEGNFGNVSTSFNDFEFELGSLTETEPFLHNLGKIPAPLAPDRFIMPSFTVGNLPDGKAGELVLVTDEVNGLAPAFFDGSDWRRMSDNQIVSTV